MHEDVGKRTSVSLRTKEFFAVHNPNVRRDELHCTNAQQDTHGTETETPSILTATAAQAQIRRENSTGEAVITKESAQDTVVGSVDNRAIAVEILISVGQN